MTGWEIETLEGVMSTAEGGVYNVISREAVEALLADNEALKLLAEHGFEVTPYINDVGEVVGHVIRTATSSNGATTAVSNTVNVLVKEQVVDQAMIDSVASGSIGTAADVGALNVGETVSEVTLTGGGAGVGGTALATVAGPAIAVGLGVAAGVVMYNIAPEFWTGVSEKLVAAGKTIGGKVISFFDKDGKTYYDDETINIIKQELINKGYLTEEDTSELRQNEEAKKIDTYGTLKDPIPTASLQTLTWDNRKNVRFLSSEGQSKVYFTNYSFNPENPLSSQIHYPYACSKLPFSIKRYNEKNTLVDTWEYKNPITHRGKTYYVTMPKVTAETSDIPYAFTTTETKNKISFDDLAYIILFASTTEEGDVPQVKPLPTEGTKEVPSGNPSKDDNEKKKVYPFPFPSSLPNPDDNDDPSSDPSDNHDPDPTPNDDDRSNPKDDPNDKPKGEPDDKPSPNPDPNQPESNPTDDKPKDPDDPNPKDPDGGKTPDSPFPIVPSAGLGNIYNPTRAQVEALQSYLWSSTNLIDIMKIFQNPVEGIISLHWVFGTPIQGASKEITLGYLPTGVSAPTVANQFIDIDCGTISIPLKQKNALDYPPYTDIQIYLPFIGIQPLNAYDLVGGTLNVKYRIDAYTGACVAKLTATRGGLSAKLYEFAGNCGYELPLTSGNFIGMVGNVVSGAVMGALTGGVAGAALGATGSAIHSNLNVIRSGNLSANAGICGSRNPYIIITRAVPYDAANYNQFYGYPSNKTVYLSNCKGFTKVKEIILHTSATQAEKEEIEALLKEGVYL